MGVIPQRTHAVLIWMINGIPPLITPLPPSPPSLWNPNSPLHLLLAISSPMMTFTLHCLSFPQHFLFSADFPTSYLSFRWPPTSFFTTSLQFLLPFAYLLFCSSKSEMSLRAVDLQAMINSLPQWPALSVHQPYCQSAKQQAALQSNFNKDKPRSFQYSSALSKCSFLPLPSHAWGFVWGIRRYVSSATSSEGKTEDTMWPYIVYIDHKLI